MQIRSGNNNQGSPKATQGYYGWLHDKSGTMAMLYGELWLPAVTIAAFGLFVVATRSRKKVAGA